MSEDDLVVPPELFDPDFDEYHRALEKLGEVLLDVGFHVHKKRDRESTLRVYLDRGVDYPLLNPVLVLEPEASESTGEDGEPVVAGIAVAVLSKGNLPDLDAKLSSFTPADDVWFIPPETGVGQSGEYVLHGSFSILVPFVPDVNPGEIDFKALAEPWRRIHAHLS